jgi:hypothetical protein
MFRKRLQYRLYTEMHNRLWASYMDTFRGYWLLRVILGQTHDGRNRF